MRSKFLNSLLALSIFSYLIFYLHEKTDLLTLKKINIHIESTDYFRLTDNEKKLKEKSMDLISKYKAQSLFKIPVNEIVKQIKSNPKIDKVNVYRKWPSVLEVSIKTHQALALWIRGKKLIPVSQTGELLPALRMNQALDLVIFNGDFFKKLENRKKAISFLPLFKNRKNINDKNLSEMIYLKDKGFLISLSFWTLKILFGKEISEDKIKKVETIVSYLHEQSNPAKKIDIRYDKKAFVSLKED